MKRKRILSLLLAAALLLATIRRAPDQTHENVIHNATQLSSDSSGDFSYQNAGTSIIVTGYAGDSDKIVIPNRIKGLPVTSISESALEGLEKLELVEQIKCRDDASSRAPQAGCGTASLDAEDPAEAFSGDLFGRSRFAAFPQYLDNGL